MRKCLMLDVDGVLINGRPEDGRSWETSIREDLGIDPKTLQDIFFRPHWTEIVTGCKGIAETLDICLPLLTHTITTEQFLQYWFQNDARLDKAVLADCLMLRKGGMSVFLASNQEHLRARYIMKDLGVGEHVDGMIHSAGLGTRKPEIAFFDAAAAATGFPADAIILVDDTVANIEGARAAGWDARLWTGDTTLRGLLDPGKG